VSHGLGDIEQFCDRALLVERGEALFVGPSVAAVKRYYLLESREKLQSARSADVPDRQSVPGEMLAWPEGLPIHAVPESAQRSDGWARCVGVAVCDELGIESRVFEQGQRAVFWYEFEVLRDTEVPVTGLVIQNEKGTIVHGKSTLESGTEVPAGLRGGERFRVRHEIALEVGIGEYTFEVGLAMMNRNIYEQRRQLSHADLSAGLVWLCAVPAAGQFAVVFRRPAGEVQLLHHGAANLPGSIQVSTLAVVPEKMTG
jgi:lipopolysaccharide transport system ATP-binding protein